MNFASRLKELRTEKGLTQTELGELVGINYSTLSDYERGNKTDPYMSTLRTLSAFFDVSIDYLIGESDIKNNEIIEKCQELLKKLTDENVKKVYSYAEFLRGEQDGRNSNV
jgi:transcriptional regulator with XRE-family HTH domain